MILYCASGSRSAYAARTLTEDLGYEHVRSMTGGITLWKDRGYEVEIPRALSAEQRDRYSRHLLIPEIGAEGQQKLLDAKVLLLGAGGLGSPTALYLAAAGVGTLGIVDDDVVDLSNLQRQVIHSTQRIGIPKVDSAEESIHALNPDVERRQVPDPHRRLEHHGDHRGLRRDRRRRRQLPHALPAQRRDRAPEDPGRVRLDPRLRRPAVGVQALRGPVLPLPVPRAAAGRARARPAAPTACSACCPGTMGLLQATEVVKLILGIGDPAIGRLLLYDALGATLTEVKVHRDPECPICSRDPDEIADEEMGVFPDYEAFCAAAG